MAIPDIRECAVELSSSSKFSTTPPQPHYAYCSCVALYDGTVVFYCTSIHHCYLLHEVHDTGLFTENFENPRSTPVAHHSTTTAMVQLVLLGNHQEQDFMGRYTIIRTAGILTY